MLDMPEKPVERSLRSIAFYLPQFHPDPHNDIFWGTGFTEWRNVTQARPRFRGHAQPHLPADLGFYDLRLEEARMAQVELARASGLSGFCYYHYWFSGTRALNRPFDDVLATGKPTFPFMLCWANENWTRVWDGGNNEVLLRQSYSDEDTVAHARHLFPAFADPRYICIDRRPVFAVYNVDELPDPRQWSDLFRKTCQCEGEVNPYLIRVERYLDRDLRVPEDLGFEAALEFQPFSRNFRSWQKTRPDLKANPLRRVANRLRHQLGSLVDMDTHYDMSAFVDFDIKQGLPSYPHFPGVCPSWDNSARRPDGKAIIFKKSSPNLFSEWIKAKSNAYRPDGDANLLFINAWNEWAEGNHLEPCLRYGNAWLNAVKRNKEGLLSA